VVEQIEEIGTEAQVVTFHIKSDQDLAPMGKSETMQRWK